ncbi:inner membrane complex protein 1m, putative [Hepatocystis sp. ex Piliocolobus tephrosceles]|nr:inner membrane complex protein 1m, putative [Hepatocystis sp. ex Piliocolobus tephrosceles]
MCDNICENRQKYVLGPVPGLTIPNSYSPPCTINQGYPSYIPTVSTKNNIIHESTITVPKIEYKEKIVEVPRTAYRPYEVIKEVEAPIYKDVYKYKNVEVPQKMLKLKPLYKVVDVPQVKHVEKFVKTKYKRINYIPKEVKVPFRPKREIYTEVPMPRYVPQHMRNNIQDQTIASAYNGQLPLFDGYDQNLLYMMNPFASFPKREKKKCFLNCLCDDNNNEMYHEDDATILPSVMPPIYTTNNYRDNNLCCIENEYELYPNPHNMLEYNYYYPLPINNNNNMCNTVIDATSSILAAAGVFVLLIGKLSLDGISLLFKNNLMEDEKIEINDEFVEKKNEKKSQKRRVQVKEG